MKRRYLVTLFLLILGALLLSCRGNSPATAVPDPTTAGPTREPQFTPTVTPNAGGESAPETAVPDTTNDNPDTVSVTLDETHPLDDFPPDQPLIFQFNQPMNAGHPNPVLIAPNVNGEFSWSAGDRTLTFTPDISFQRDRRYTVRINNGLRSRDGDAFSSMPRWQLATQDTPAVSRRTPRGVDMTEFMPTFQLTFDRPMELPTVAAALSFTPPLPYQASWEGEMLQISLLEPLAFGATYEGTVAKTAADTAGLTMAQPYTWRFQLSDVVAGIGWPSSAGPGGPIFVDFNYPIAPADDLLTLSPAVDGAWEWNESGTRATFASANRLPVDTTFTLTFGGSWQTEDGHALPAPETAVFTTPPAILAAAPQSETNPALPITIQFDRPMDHDSVAAAFTIDPPVAGSFSWEGNRLFFQPDGGYFAGETRFTVSIAASALDDEGTAVLRRPYSWQFSTSALETLADFGFGPNVQVVDAAGRRTIHFQAWHRAELQINFALHRATLPQFLAAYAAGFNSTWWERSDPDIPTTELVPAAAWSSITTTDINEWGNIQETIIPADVPPGLYLLTMTAGRPTAQLFVVVSDNTITAKVGDDELTAWLTDINGGVRAGLPVQLYDETGQLLVSGVTDTAGVFAAAVPGIDEAFRGENQPNWLLVAGSGSDLTISGLTAQWSGTGYWGWTAGRVAPEAAVYTITDRPIYRPGHTVYFKSIIRLDDDANLSLPPAGTAVTARVRDSRDNLVQSFNLRTNDFGTINGQFSIAAGAPLGSYQLELVLNDDTFRQPFKVEEYRTPDYTVTVSTDASQFVRGAEFPIAIDAAYLFGQPVAGAQVEIRRYRLWDSYDGLEEYFWEDVSSYTGGSIVRGMTDDNGRFTTTLRAITADGYNSDQTYYAGFAGSSLEYQTIGLEATINDGSNQTASGYVVLRIYNSYEGVTLDSGGWAHEAGRPFTVRAGVTTIDDEPVAGRSLTLQLRRYRSGTGRYDEAVANWSLTTAENGRALTQITVEEPGYYQLHVRGQDSAGRMMEYVRWIYITGDDYPVWTGSGGDLRLTADQQEYAVGDTAELLVESPFGGPALLTIERGTVHRQQLITLTPPLTTIELPIQPGDAPNVYAAISLWEPLDTAITTSMYESRSDSRLRSAAVNLSVPPVEKELQVTITPDREEYAPGDEATFTVRVTNRQGVPVSAELSAALVDEAIFELSEELSGPIFDGFYFERENNVRTFNSLAPYRYMGGGFGGGGGGGPMPGSLRQSFEDTALWLPSVTTDFNGEATFSVTLPDNLTSWRLTAKAVTADTQVGEATANIITSQEIVVRPLLPRVLTAGDIANLSAIVHNYADEPQTLTVALAIDSEAGFLIAAPVTQTITLPAGGMEIVGWQVTAQRAAAAQVRVTAVSPAGSGDAVQLPLTVQPLAIPDVTTRVGEFTSLLETDFTMPAAAQEMSYVEIRLSRSIAGSMLEGLAYLTGYPYGCVEQTMSRALPNAVIGRAFTELGIDNPDLAESLPPQINAGIQRLYGFQHDDGGWGWWYDDISSDYQTAWVLFGLAQTAAADYEIDPAAIARAVSFLENGMADMDARTRAFALYSMALAGAGDLAATETLLGATQLDTFSRAALALTLFELGETGAANELLDELMAEAVVENGRAYWPGAGGDGAYDQKVMASTTRTTAMMLSALSRIRPGTALESDAVRYLMAARRQHGWGTTNETAFALLGLTDHLRAAGFSESGAATSYTVQLNGTAYATGTLDRGEPMVTIRVPRELVENGRNSLTITQSGSPRLYYTINSHAFLARGVENAAGPIQIERSYRDPETHRPLESIQTGDLVEVQLRVTLSQPASYMIVEDQLPAGLEALNERLNNTSHEVIGYQEPRFHWREYGYNQKEIRDNRVSFFITEMEARTYTYTYIARATTAGTFTAMPATAYAMYDDTLWGRSASGELNIGP